MTEEFAANGFWIHRGALGGALLRELQAWADTWLEAQPTEHFKRFRHHGSMLPLDYRDPLPQRLISHASTLRALRELGYQDPRWLSGYLISKPPRSPGLWWHQDWWAWDEPASFASDPPQLFVMYYLTDVDERNGCLRVIPGSHRRAHPLHRELPDAHGMEIGRPERASSAHQVREDEVSVGVRAGDAVVGDVRLLHATHPNASDARRSCITVWYLPTYAQLAPPLQAYVQAHPSQPPADWWKDPDSVPQCLRRLLPIYEGDAEPALYNRTPPVEWPLD